MPKPQLIEDEIGRKLAEASRSGELQSAKGYGQAFEFDAAWAQTPEALRMPFKILKNADVLPAEIEMFRSRAALRLQIADCTDPEQRLSAQTKLSALEQAIALRLEVLRRQS